MTTTTSPVDRAAPADPPGDPTPGVTAGTRLGRLPITGLGVAAAAGGVGCLLVGLVTGWSEFLVAAMVLGVVVALSSVFLIGRSSYTITLALDNARVVAGQPAGGVLTTRNSGSRRLLGSRIEVPVGASLASFRIGALGADDEQEDLFVIPTARRAVITVGPATSVRGDALGLLRRQVRWTAAEQLFVHPRTVRLHGAATGIIRDLEGRPTRDLSSNDVSFHALRGYVPGDDRRYVHWRTSARTGVLMVRQFEETRRTHLAVALSADPDEYGAAEEFELAISAAASLGSQALREERPVTVCVGPRSLPGTTGRRLLDTFAGVGTETGAGVVVAARAAATAVPNASVAVLITGPRPDPAMLRRASNAFPAGIRVVAVQIEADAELRLTAIGDVDVATIGTLDDLPRALRRMRAA